jgi:hypothetical protein
MTRGVRMLRGKQFWLAALACCIGAAAARAVDQVDFETQIAPLLVRHCGACHNDSQASGGLNLMRRESAFAPADSGSSAIVPGDLDSSYLHSRVAAGEMPPPGKAAPVSDDEKGLLATWIKSGAAWPAQRVLSPFEWTSSTRAGRDWWSLQPPKRPLTPPVRNIERQRTPIDAFVLARLEGQGLQLSADADRSTFIRRASLDLLGLPPSPEDIEAFVNDSAPDAYEKLIDRLLASPRYGERWGRHWLDVVRFGESNGYETNTARSNAWPYRDWVIQAFNSDVPFPQFVLEQLAGDQVGVDAATGYLVGGAHDIVKSPDIELTSQQRANDLDDMISTTSSAFLGLTVGCARCHDHKFDPISQRDYYALAAIFAGVEHGERDFRTADSPRRKQQEAEAAAELTGSERRVLDLWTRAQPLALVGTSTPSTQRPSVTAAINLDRFTPVRARFVRFTILETNQFEPCIDELEIWTAGDESRNVALAKAGGKATASSVFANGRSDIHRLAHINDGRLGNSRSWISAEVGAGWVQIELPDATLIDRVVWARDRKREFRDRLATGYRIETSQDGAAWQVVASSDDRRPFDPRAPEPAALPVEGLPADVRAEIERQQGEVDALRGKLARFAPPKVYAGTFVKPQPTHLLYRGEPLQKREHIAPAAIASVKSQLVISEEQDEAQRRVALARWIASPGNPLSSRVLVNRIWHYHFGRGLVASPGDFGFNGGQPSHPELLDWLATELIERSWSLKSIHRVIMLSTTYRQNSRYDAASASGDALDRLLWRFPPRRLEAEAIRDSILFASGSLDVRMGGPGYDVFEPNTNYVKVYTPKRDFGPAEWRRMVYQEKPRMRQDATFGEFDCPDSSQVMARRNVSTTALQALNLSNSPFVLGQARLFAERLQRDVADNRDGQIERAFRLAFGRGPDKQERDQAAELVNEHGLAVLCRALYNANEFLYLD